jgi:hypothetical protein
MEFVFVILLFLAHSGSCIGKTLNFHMRQMAGDEVEISAILGGFL